MCSFGIRHRVVAGVALREAGLTPPVGKRTLTLVTAYAIDGWAALGDPTRRTIFERILDGPRSVSELASGLPVSRPAVSQHLRVLKQAGLVVVQRVGTRSIYEVDREGLARLRAEMDRYWSDALSGYARAVRQPRQEGS